MVGRFFVPGGLVFVVATVPILFGAVQPIVWSVYAGIIISIFLVGYWREEVELGFVRHPVFLVSVCFFFLCALFQAISLPPAVLRLLSPVRYAVLDQASGLHGNSISWNPVSYIAGASFFWSVFLISLVLFFGIFKSYVQEHQNLVRMTVLLVGVALFQSAYGLIQALVPTLGVLWVDYIPSYLGDARGTYINRNHFAGMIEMIWPLGFGLMLAYGSIWRRQRPGHVGQANQIKLFFSTDKAGFQLMFFSALLIILLALLFSKSRAGIMGAFVGFLSFLILTRVGGKRFSALSWGVIGFGFGFLMLYGQVIGFHEIVGRFMAVSDNAGSRFDIWRDTWTMIKDHPLGIGLRNYASVMPVYNSLGPYDIKFLHAHNDYLQLIAEAGWPGFLALVGGFYYFLIGSIRRIGTIGRNLDPVRFYVGIGACRGLISIAFHSFFDFNLQIPANLVYFVCLMGIVYSCFWEPRSSEEKEEGTTKARRTRRKANDFLSGGWDAG